MASYIIRGWKQEDYDQHTFAHREASRGNMYTSYHYNAQAEEYRFEAADDEEAKMLAERDHPELSSCRLLLKVIS